MIDTATQPITNNSLRRYYRPLEPLLQKPKNRVYTATILSFLTVSLFVWYAIRPTIQTILSLKREISDNISVNEQMDAKIGSLVEAQALYQSISNQLPLLNEAVPESANIVDFVEQLRALASARNIQITQANVSTISLSTIPAPKQLPVEAENIEGSPPTPVESPMMNATPVTISIKGNYENLREFILGMHSMRRIATITNLSVIPITKTEEGEPENQLGMTLNLTIFSSPKEY